jgi:hypothetical protein
MPTTLVDLCNMALAHLRQRPVTGDDTGILGDTPEAVNCRRFYEIAMRECFRAFDWQFARRYVASPLIPGAALPNWKYAYEYPQGVEAIRYIARTDRTEAPVRFRVMRTPDGSVGQLAVYTNEQAAYIACTLFISDPTEFPSDFVEFASLTLAAHLAMPITGKADLMMGMRKLAEDAGKRAAATAASSETDDDGESDPRADPLPANSVPIEIANLALGLIGQDAIVSFGERTKQANAVRRYYSIALRAALRSVDWPFARTYVQAVPSNGPAVMTGWRYAYAYPDNCAAVRGFAKRYPTDYDARFQVAGRFILCNKPLQTLIYTRWDVDPAAYDSEFTALLAHELAAMIALPVTGKNDAAVYLRGVAKALRDKARADAANEAGDELDERVPEWLAVRGVPSLTREDRERYHGAYAWDRQGGPWGSLPGSGAVNPTPPMITGPGPGSAILPAYIPGLTAPIEPTPQLLSSSDFWVESTGGRIERDGTLVIDDPSQEVIEADYDIQEDN